MEWGDVPAWVAIGISVVAGGHSWWTGRKADAAKAGTASVEESLERIADALARDRDRTTAEAAAHGHITIGGQAPPTAAPTPPTFNAEFVAGHSYRLRNVGVTTATNLAVTVEDFANGIAQGLPSGVHLQPLASTDPFIIRGSIGQPMAGEVLVTCDELPRPVRVPLPPTR